jgi:hemolysin activation/secretion protein
MQKAARAARSRRRRFLLRSAIGLAALGWGATSPASAQVPVPRPRSGASLPRPADDKPDLPRLEMRERARRSVLPPLQLPELPAVGAGSAPSTSEAIAVAGLRVRGNTLLDPAELQSVLMSYAGASLTFEQLLRLQDELTMLYVKRGYVTSGVLLSPVPSRDGFVEFDVTEGVLREVRVSGARSFRESAVRARASRERRRRQRRQHGATLACHAGRSAH